MVEMLMGRQWVWGVGGPLLRLFPTRIQLRSDACTTGTQGNTQTRVMEGAQAPRVGPSVRPSQSPDYHAIGRLWNGEKVFNNE